MKKIITAINNPKLNEELKKENNFEIIGKDIQYKEAILEILEKNKNIDLIIISEQILGEINFEKLIEKIKLINNKIKLIFILEKENNDLEKILIKNNINNIYYNNKINLSELIKIINKNEINMEEEIIKLKKIIEEKKIKENQKEEKKSNIVEEKYKKETCKNTRKNAIMSSKIITFSGNAKSGKTSLSLIISQYLSNNNYKVLLIDGDFNKQDLKFILKDEIKNNRKKYIQLKNKNKKYKKNNNYLKKEKLNSEFRIVNNQKNKFNLIKINNKNKFNLNNIINKKIKIKKIKKLEIKKLNTKNKNDFYKIKKELNNYTKKINDNFYFFSEFYKMKNKKNIKKIIEIFFIIIKNKYDFIIIDMGNENFLDINHEIFKYSHINFILMDATLLGIKEVEKLYNLYLQKWKVDKNSLHIIKNKSNMFDINTRIISKIIPIKNEILKIKENKKFLILINNYFKRNILLKNKNIKKDIKKIIKIIYF